MRKRGSHVGIIASFTIFLFFLVSMYFIMEPVLKVQKDKISLLDYVKKSLAEEFSGNLTIVAVNSSGFSCIQINNSNVSVQTPSYAIVKNKNNLIINSSFSGDILKINSSSEPVLWVYYSDVQFYSAPTGISCSNYPVIESIRDNRELFETKILQGISNLTNLTQKFEIPKESGFDFSFEANNGSIISNEIQDIKENIYAGELIIQYIDEKANSLAGKIKVRVW